MGIEEKIRNIEATEEAKKKLADARQRLALKHQQNNSAADFAPTNLAVNFKQPNRFRSDVEVRAKAVLFLNENLVIFLPNYLATRTEIDKHFNYFSNIPSNIRFQSYKIL